MGKVVLDITMSLDGFITAKDRLAEKRGEGIERLHKWVFSDADPRDREMLNRVWESGAIIAGRETYDVSLPSWGVDGPTGEFRRPVFVVTHHAPAELPENGVYTFVTDGIEQALKQAQAVAGDKVVQVMGGANVAQQCIRAGLLDELHIHIAPVLFGSGTPLFDDIGDEHISLETVQVINTEAATHVHYRVVK